MQRKSQKNAKKYRKSRLFPRTVGSDICPAGKRYAARDICPIGAKRRYEARDMFAFANEGKYHFASSEARYIASGESPYIAFCIYAKHIAH